MSTPCEVKVIQEGMPWDEEATLYHHWDGYPTNMVPIFAMAWKIGQEKVSDPYMLGRAGKVAGIVCAADPGGFEPTPANAPYGALDYDLAYYYVLYAMNVDLDRYRRWELEVFAVRYDYHRKAGAERDLTLLDARQDIPTLLKKYPPYLPYHADLIEA